MTTSDPTARVELPEPLQKREPPPEPKSLKDVAAVSTETAPKPSPAPHRRRAMIVLLIALFLLAAWWVSGYFFAYTDDAYLTSDLVSITPEVTGPIKAVHVTDNQRVKRGTVLFTIDPEPFALELEQARAREAQAEAQLPIDKAQIEDLKAQKESADAAAQLAITNLGRDTPLGRSGYLSAEALDRSRAVRDESVARQRAAQAALDRAMETLRLHQVAVEAARAARRLAEWRLSRTKPVAPVDGHVTHLTLQPGDMASTDHAALAIVAADAWRVVANYKEYYLRHFRPDHDAWVWLDTQPWHFYRARIQGMAHGISREKGGPELMPYVSPTVDWIRLQRRIPVRLTLIDSPDAEQLFMGADARVLIVY